MQNMATPIDSSAAHSPRLTARYESISETLGILAFIIGLSVLAGWVFGISPLKSVFSGLVTMKVNAAIGFMLLSLSLWLSQSKRAGNRAMRMGALACSWAAILIGSLTLAEYIFDWNPGIDQILIKEGSGAVNTPHPGRPSPLLALSLVFIGAAILAIDAPQRKGFHPAHLLLFPAALISLLTFFGHLYGIHYFLYSIPGVTAIALHSTAAFLMLCLGVVFARPAHGTTSILISGTGGGVLARRMLFQSILALIILDYAIHVGHQMGYYDEAYETVIHNTLLIGFFTYTILSTSRLLEQTDITRVRTEEALKEKTRLFTNVINSSQDYIFVKDGKLRTILCNEIFAQAQNKSPEELYGKTDIENGWDTELVKGNPEKGIRGFEQDDLAALAGNVIHSDSDQGNIRGEIRYFDSIKVPLKDSEGNILGIIGISRDITDRKKAESALRLQSEITRNAAEGIVLIKASGGAIIYSNPRFDSMFGYAPEELTGKHISVVNAPTDKSPEQTANEIIKSLEESGTWSGEIQNIRKDGTAFWSFASVSVFDHPEYGNVWMSYHTDISARKKAEEERDWLFKLPLDMACIAGTDGYFKKVNPAFTRTLGFSEKEFLETPYNEFIHPDDRQPTRIEVEKQLKGGLTLDFENRYRCKDGSHKWLAWKAVALPSEGYLIATARDITEKKKAEEALIQAKENAEGATKMKDKFVSLVAHDLKSPLGSMIGFLKLVEDENVEPLNEGAKLVLKNAIESGKQMSRFIDDVLNISRLRTGQLKLDMAFFDAKYLGEKMVADYAYLAAQKEITIRNAIPANSRIYADRILLSEAMQNLITNAVKFCRKGDTVTIWRADDDKTTICVGDTGPGIGKELRENLFLYEKKTSTPGTRGEIGSGLGLPLAMDIMKLHGGAMRLESEIGKGCKFSLQLPHVRPIILIVDDDHSFRFLQEMNLRKMEAEIVQAADGVEALAAVEKKRPHLVITDIKMPVMDGLELLKRLKDKSETKDIPVMVVSGEYGMEIRDTVFKLGGEDFSTKTIDMDDFIPRVRRFIG